MKLLIMSKRFFAVMLGIFLLLNGFSLSSQARDGFLRERIRNRIIEKYQQQGNVPKSSTGMNEYRQAEQQSAQNLNYLTVNGIERSYLLHVPKKYSPPDDSNSQQWPFVIALHGGGGNATISDLVTGLPKLVDEKQFILVTPNGTGPMKDKLLTWNAGNCCGSAYEKHVDDVAFVRDLIQQVSEQYAIDPKRVYVTGMSNGGKMAYRLGCQLSDKIAAIAPVAGSLDEAVCKPTSPVSVIAFHGTADEHVPYNGGAPIKNMDKWHPRVDHSVAESVGFWRKFNRCDAKPLIDKTGKIIRSEYSNCQNGAAVVLYTIEGGGHSWPGADWKRQRADESMDEVSASERMIDFFLRHPKP